MKTFYFMSSLPRSGSTLLSTLLNQNPNIYSPEQDTDLVTSMDFYETNIVNYESASAGVHSHSYFQVLGDMAKSFYKDIDKPIIIDKNRSWGLERGLNLAKYVSQTPKVVFVYRPIIEILTSWITLCEMNPNNFIDNSIKNLDLNPRNYRPINDVRCDAIMNFQIERYLNIYTQALKDKTTFQLVSYNEIITNPQETLNNIYKFLNIPEYEHNSNSIIKVNNWDDNFAFGIDTLHEVRPTLNKISKEPSDVLSNYILNKYSNYLENLHENNI